MSTFEEIFLRLLRDEVPSGDLTGIDDDVIHGIYVKAWVEYIKRFRYGYQKAVICPPADIELGLNRMDDTIRKEMDELLRRDEENGIPIVCLPPKEGERCSD